MADDRRDADREGDRPQPEGPHDRPDGPDVKGPDEGQPRGIGPIADERAAEADPLRDTLKDRPRRERRSRDEDADRAYSEQVTNLFSGERLEREQLRRVYVRPAEYARARAVLQDRRVVVLQGRHSGGKYALAQHLLDALKVEQIEEIDPDTGPDRLLEHRFRPSVGYVVDTLASEQARRLRGFHLRQLRSDLESWGSYLVITVDDRTAVLPDEESEQLIPCISVPTPRKVLLRHLRLYLGDRGGLRRADLAWLCGDSVRRALADDSKPRRAAQLARALTPILAEEPGQDRRQRLEGALRDFRDPVRQAAACLQRPPNPDPAHWSFVLALAVFSGETYHVVADAASSLERRLNPPAEADAEERWQPGPVHSERVGMAGAEVVDDFEMATAFGRSPVRRVKFKDEGLQGAVLDYVWAEFDQLRAPVREWLDELGEDPDEGVRVRAARTVGYLARHGFGYVLGRILVPWATRGERTRDTAAIALGFLVADQQFAGQVLTLLRYWARHDDYSLREAAAVAHGRVGARFPSAALRDLREIVRRTGQLHTRTVVESLTELVWRGRGPEVVEALDDWTRQVDTAPAREAPAERALAKVGLVAFSWAANLFEEAAPPRLGWWPLLLDLAERDGVVYRRVATLWRRMLADDVTAAEAAEVLCQWMRAGDDEASLVGDEQRRLAGALGDLLARVAEGGTADAGRVRHALNLCAHEGDEPSETAQKLAAEIG